MTSTESMAHPAKASAIYRTGEIVSLLRELQEMDPEIEATAVVSIEGVIIASSLRSGLNNERVAAMSAAMVGLGERIAMELGRGKLDQVVIRGEEGSVILISINEDHVLTAVIKDEMQLGLVFLDMRRTVVELARIV